MSTSYSPQRFVAVLSPALRQAAAIARALEGRVANRPKSGEATAVKAALTIADTAAQETLLVPLLEHFPDVRLEAEEDTPSVRRFPRDGDARVVVDPIDGTFHSYLGAEGPYAVMIGLAVGDRYEAALVGLPREGLFFEAIRGEGARVSRSAGAWQPAELEAGGRRVLVSHGLPEAPLRHLEACGYEVVRGCGGAVALAPLMPGHCAGLRIARGTSSISPRGRIPALIASEAGALLRREAGEPFPPRLGEPARALVAASTSGDLAALERALATVDLSSS